MKVFIRALVLVLLLCGSAQGGMIADMIMNSGPRLVWEALTYDPATYEMELQSTGTGTPTLTRTTTQYCLDSSGVYQAATANNPCWKGARYDTGVAYATDGVGSLLSPIPLLQVDPALTNSLFNSSDLTGWTQTGTAVSAYNAVGLTGAANTATTLTDDDGALAEHVYKVTAVPNDSNYNILKVFIKRGSVGYAAIHSKHTGGTETQIRLIFDLSSGDVTASQYGTADESYAVETLDNWYILYVSVKNNSSGNTNHYTYFYPAYSADGTTTASTAATGSCIVGNAELYRNKTIAQVRGAGPIFTTTAAVTTGAQTGPTFDSGNISDTSGLITFSASTEGANNFLSTFVGHDGTNAQIADGTTTDTAVAAVSTTHKIGVWWHGSQMGLVLNGVANSAVAYDGTMLSGNLDAIRSAAYSGTIGNIRGYRSGTAATYQAKAVEDTTP